MCVCARAALLTLAPPVPPPPAPVLENPPHSLVKGGVFVGSTMSDVVVGAICVAISVTILTLALFALVKLLRWISEGAARTMIKKALNTNDYVASYVLLHTSPMHTLTSITDALSLSLSLSPLSQSSWVSAPLWWCRAALSSPQSSHPLSGLALSHSRRPTPSQLAPTLAQHSVRCWQRSPLTRPLAFR